MNSDASFTWAVKIFLGLAVVVTTATAAHAQDMEFDTTDVETPKDETGELNENEDASEQPLDGDELQETVALESTDEIAPEDAKAPSLAKDAVDKDWVRVVQRKPLLRKNRFEISPLVGVSVNDPMARHYMVGGVANYYISENLALGFDSIFSFGHQTSLFDKLINDFELVSDRVILQAYIGPHVSYVPIYGKFALFNNWIWYWDFYVTLGAGYVRTRIPAADSGGAMINAGQRIYLTRWLTAYWDVRDYMYFANFGDDNDRFNQTLVVSVGASFFFPFDFQYK